VKQLAKRCFLTYTIEILPDHSKEHCLVGFKRPADKVGEGSMTKEEIREALSWVKSGIDTDVIVAEVRENSDCRGGRCLLDKVMS
jgi:hypothetical protein